MVNNEIFPTHDERFLEKHLGKEMLQNPTVAIVELISNSWDAGSSQVDIVWPDNDSQSLFKISDNGIGLSEDSFQRIWNKLHYNRKDDIGLDVRFPEKLNHLSPRKVYGKNGKGRFSAFTFGNEYKVTTKNNGKKCIFLISRFQDNHPFKIAKIDECTIDINESGLEIEVKECKSISIDEESIRAEIGLRFLTDTSFKVTLNNSPIKFGDIPEENIEVIEDVVDGVGSYKITALDTTKADKTSHLHGIAWHVNNRLVGNCTWKGAHIDKRYVDGRTNEAKRYVFIVQADCLSESDSVSPDWSGFQNTNEYISVSESVGENIRKFFHEKRRGKIKEYSESLKLKNAKILNKLSPIERNMWLKFINDVQENCPNIESSELDQVAEILAKLEAANSQYSLLSQINDLESNQMDDLHEILSEWSLVMAKKVLDDIKRRLLIIEELKRKTLYSEKVDEVHELQPLFDQGLWIFGPEFETIHYTSNKGITNVANKIFGKKVTGSRNRPDFVISDDGSLGFYAYDRFDQNGSGAEVGVEKLVIIELKTLNIPIGEETFNQCRKYVRELTKLSLIDKSTRVQCFALGSEIDPLNTEPLDQGNMTITPLTYSTIIRRAESRLFRLGDQIKDAPFLTEENKDELEAFMNNGDTVPEQKSLILSRIEVSPTS